MNTRTIKLLSTFSPTLLITIYSNQEQHEYYLESHDIGPKGEVYEGKPLKQETLQGIVDVFHTEQKDRMHITGIVPENLLQFSNEESNKYNLVWYTKAGPRYLYFQEGLNLPSGTANVPAMLYIATNKSLKVYALADDNRPTEDTALYQAPFYNTNTTSGAVCLGSAKAQKPKVKTYQSLMEYWEAIFWNSAFTHGESHTKSPMNLLWQRLLADNTITWASLDELLPANRTLKQLLTGKHIGAWD